VDVERIFDAILKHEYPNGFPLLPNHGASMREVYPRKYKLAEMVAREFNK
jgi:hypothetical protein